MRPPPYHVWVDQTAKWLMSAHPGLLQMRERREDGWYGFVTWMEPVAHAHGGDDVARAKMAWLPAECIRPAKVEPPPADLSGVRPVRGKPS